MLPFIWSDPGADALVGEPMDRRPTTDHHVQVRDDNAGQGGELANQALPAQAFPALNPVRLRTLNDSGGGSLELLVPAFLLAAERATVQLRLAEARGDVVLIATVAHRLRGSALTLGAEALAEVCRHAEAFADAGELTAAVALLGPIERELDRASSALTLERRRVR